MMIGFCIWTLCASIFIVIGISVWKSKEAVGFFTGQKPPQIPKANVKKYNHAVAIIWFSYGLILEALGLPIFFCDQNSPYFIITILGTMYLSIGIIIAYMKVQKHFMKE